VERGYRAQKRALRAFPPPWKRFHHQDPEAGGLPRLKEKIVSATTLGGKENGARLRDDCARLWSATLAWTLMPAQTGR